MYNIIIIIANVYYAGDAYCAQNGYPLYLEVFQFQNYLASIFTGMTLLPWKSCGHVTSSHIK